jgi:hypothetical protein
LYKKSPGETPGRNLFAKSVLAGADGFDGAFRFTGTAVNAGVRIDRVFRIAFADGFDRANFFAGTAHGAVITDFIGHYVPPEVFFGCKRRDEEYATILIVQDHFSNDWKLFQGLEKVRHGRFYGHSEGCMVQGATN